MPVLTSINGLMEVFHHSGKSMRLLIEKVSCKKIESEMHSKSSRKKLEGLQPH